MTARSDGPQSALTFRGSAAIVTGGGSGIGAAIVDALVEAGVRTTALDVRPSDRRSDAVRHVTVDVSDRDAVQRAVAQSGSDDGLAYVVNCAGLLLDTGFNGVDQHAWQSTMSVNVVGAYNVIEASAEFLARARSSAIVNITSIEASHVVALSNPDPSPAYAASKAALAMLTRTAARALAPQGTRVNSIAPGFVSTPMAAAAHGESIDLPPHLRARVPLGRFGRPADIAAAVLFLLSDQAAYITGAELVADGGFAVS